MGFILMYECMATGTVHYISEEMDAETVTPDYEGDGTLGYTQMGMVRYLGPMPTHGQVETG